MPVKKILILRFSSLGDIVMTTPMIRALSQTYPQAQIDMIVRSEFLDLIRFNPRLNQKIGLARKEGMAGLLKLRKWINEQNYDVIYDAHRSLRTLFLMPFLCAPQKFYFQKYYIKRSLALTFKIPLLKNFGRFIERYVTPLKPLGVTYDGKGPELFIDDTVRSDAFSRVARPSTPSRCIGLIPSAQWPGKRWPLPYFRELIQRLITETNYHFILFGGPEDTFCNELIAGLDLSRITNTQGKLSIAGSAAFLELCDLVIANDTGLMHMADALDIPSVLFLGPTSREMGCLPFHPQALILEQTLWCRPCSKNGQAPCIRAQRYCLTRTTPEMALTAVKLLAEKVSRA